MEDDAQPSQQHQPLLPKQAQLQPSSSRLLQGILDLVMLFVGLILLVLVRVLRFLIRITGLANKKSLRMRNINASISTSTARCITARDFGEANDECRDLSEGLLQQADVKEAGNGYPGVDDDLQEIKAALAACKSGVLSMFLTRENDKNVLVDSEDFSNTPHEVVLMLKGCHGAYLQCLKQQSLMEQDLGATHLQEQVAEVLSDLLTNPSLSYTAASQKVRSIYSTAIQQAAARATSYDNSLDKKYVLREFQFLLLMHRACYCPSRMQRTVLPLQSGGVLEEMSETLDFSPAVEYLSAVGGRYQEYAQFMQQFNSLRPSGAKKQTQVQGMVMNARQHTATVTRDGTTKHLYGDLRCGAYTLHGRKPLGVGLAAMQDALQQCAKENDPTAAEDIAKKLHFESVEDLKQEVSEREVLLTAQALVVAAGALSVAVCNTRALEAAWKSGSFLILQQSLLSDLHKSEKAMLQDMQGVLRVLNQRLRVRFELSPPAHMLEVDQEQITLCIDASRLSALQDVELQAESFTLLCTPGEFAQRTYGVTWLLANQGVNVWQSLGFLSCGDSTELLQDRLNANALNGLERYAALIGAESKVTPLAEHFSDQGSRSAKDLEAVKLMREAVSELGGVRVVNCKSGKDRTAMEVASAMAWETVRQGYVPMGLHYFLHDKFTSGLSFAMTSQNNGLPNAFAFSEPELMTLPSGWAPDWKLCGNVDS